MNSHNASCICEIKENLFSDKTEIYFTIPQHIRTQIYFHDFFLVNPYKKPRPQLLLDTILISYFFCIQGQRAILQA